MMSNFAHATTAQLSCHLQKIWTISPLEFLAWAQNDFLLEGEGGGGQYGYLINVFTWNIWCISRFYVMKWPISRFSIICIFRQRPRKRDREKHNVNITISRLKMAFFTNSRVKKNNFTITKGIANHDFRSLFGRFYVFTREKHPFRGSRKTYCPPVLQGINFTRAIYYRTPRIGCCCNLHLIEIGLRHTCTLKFIVAWWRHMVKWIWVHLGSGNGLLPDSTKPLPEPMLTYHK